MIRVGRGRSAVTIDGPLAEGLEREIRDALGPLAGHLQKEADGILAKAREDWPVRTGKSRDAFKTMLQVEPGTFKVSVHIGNAAPYAKYIKSTKEGRKRDAARLRSPLQALIIKPVRRRRKDRAKELVAILAAGINKTLKG